MGEVSTESPLTLARKRKGMSQEQMAAAFAVTQPTISNWETGEATPHASLWAKIADVYGLSTARVIAFFTRERAAS